MVDPAIAGFLVIAAFDYKSVFGLSSTLIGSAFTVSFAGVNAGVTFGGTASLLVVGATALVSDNLDVYLFSRSFANFSSFSFLSSISDFPLTSTGLMLLGTPNGFGVTTAFAIPASFDLSGVVCSCITGGSIFTSS